MRLRRPKFNDIFYMYMYFSFMQTAKALARLLNWNRFSRKTRISFQEAAMALVNLCIDTDSWGPALLDNPISESSDESVDWHKLD